MDENFGFFSQNISLNFRATGLDEKAPAKETQLIRNSYKTSKFLGVIKSVTKCPFSSSLI